jgi:hypothetical protein
VDSVEEGVDLDALPLSGEAGRKRRDGKSKQDRNKPQRHDQFVESETPMSTLHPGPPCPTTSFIRRAAGASTLSGRNISFKGDQEE